MPSGQILHRSGLCPFQEGVGRWERVEQKGPFLVKVVAKHLLCHFHPQAQALDRPRMKRQPQQRGWVKTYIRQDGEASTRLSDYPVKVRPTPQVLRSPVAKIHSKQAPGSCLVTWQMFSHLGRCTNGTESLSVPGRHSEKKLLSHPAPIPTCPLLLERVSVIIAGREDQHSHQRGAYESVSRDKTDNTILL